MPFRGVCGYNVREVCASSNLYFTQVPKLRCTSIIIELHFLGFCSSGCGWATWCSQTMGRVFPCAPRMRVSLQAAGTSYLAEFVPNVSQTVIFSGVLVVSPALCWTTLCSSFSCIPQQDCMDGWPIFARAYCRGTSGMYALLWNLLAGGNILEGGDTWKLEVPSVARVQHTENSSRILTGLPKVLLLISSPKCPRYTIPPREVSQPLSPQSGVLG